MKVFEKRSAICWGRRSWPTPASWKTRCGTCRKRPAAGGCGISALWCGGQSCRAQCWLRANGTFVSASCPCARKNENGDGPCCEHIGALLLAAHRMEQQKAGALEDPAEQRRQQLLRDKVGKGSNYTNNLAMPFGKKWREDEPESDLAARQLLEVYQQEALAELESPLPLQRQGFARLEPELTLLSGSEPWLRLRVSDGEGRGYLVKSIPELLQAVEQGQMVSYSKNLCFVHQWSAFDPRAQQIRPCCAASRAPARAWKPGPAVCPRGCLREGCSCPEKRWTAWWSFTLRRGSWAGTPWRWGCRP